jgi:hypothetical protein
LTKVILFKIILTKQLLTFIFILKIRWNQNIENEHQYAVGSSSGFIFIHQIEELKYNDE